jgi:hypothetical protein
MWHLSPLAHDEVPEVAYYQLFIQGLTGTLQARVESEFKGHIGGKIMTHLVQMKLLEDAITVDINSGIIADVVHSTQLQSLAAMINAASVSGALPGILQCVQAAVNAPPSSPCGSLASG